MSVDAAAWSYAAYLICPDVAASRGVTESDMIGFASVHGLWPERDISREFSRACQNIVP